MSWRCDEAKNEAILVKVYTRNVKKSNAVSLYIALFLNQFHFGTLNVSTN